uniref:Uncharacterized protein n=1 Tax=Crocodylus porosus TaxID=8502 RepID=A0A7M4DYP5_CROPO
WGHSACPFPALPLLCILFPMLFLYIMLLLCASFALHSTSLMPYASLSLHSLHPECTFTHAFSATLSPGAPPCTVHLLLTPFPQVFLPALLTLSQLFTCPTCPFPSLGRGYKLQGGT